MAYADPEVGKARDRERFRRRTEERIAAGLCPRCGTEPPALERTMCDGCAAKRNAASRARDARLRAEGKPRRDPVRAREYERERSRREAETRQTEGLCIRCSKEPAAPGRSSCEPCLEKRREVERANYAAGKAAGLPYGGADVQVKRRAGRVRSRKRQKARIEAGLCIRCGKQPPVEGGTTCQPCRDKRQAAERTRDEFRCPDVVAIVRLLMLTGCRFGEIAALEWDWVKDRRIFLPDSKSGPRTVWLSSAARAVIDGIPRYSADCPYLFPARPPKRPVDNIAAQWNRIRDEAELPGLRLHDLRHSWASMAAMNGVGMVTIAKLLGHALVETTERYVHLADRSVADAADRVSGRIGAALAGSGAADEGGCNHADG